MSSISFGLRSLSCDLNGSLLLRQLCTNYFKVVTISIISDNPISVSHDCLFIWVEVFFFLMLNNFGLHPEHLKYHIRGLFGSPVKSKKTVGVSVLTSKWPNWAQAVSSNWPPVDHSSVCWIVSLCSPCCHVAGAWGLVHARQALHHKATPQCLCQSNALLSH